MDEQDETLYDRVHEWSLEKAKRANVAIDTRGSKEVETVMRAYGRQLKESQRFFLDDDFVYTALDLSRDLERLQYWVALARLPSETTWIEFSGHAKVMASWEQRHLAPGDEMPIPRAKDLGDDGRVKPDLSQVSPRMGFLMRQQDEQTGLWIGSQFGQVMGGRLPKGEVTPIPVDWICAPEESALLQIYSRFRHVELLHKRFPGQFSDMIPNIGIGVSAAHTEGSELVIDGHAALPWVKNHLAVAVDPIWQVAMEWFVKKHAINKQYHMRQYTDGEMVKHLKYVLEEDKGIMRFMLTVLALLNAAPNVKHYNVQRTGFRRRLSGPLPYLGHTLVTLELPKRRPLVALNRLKGDLDRIVHERRHNRAHMVRGHFREVERGKGPLGYRCDHLPTLVENGLGICTRCERLIRWIPSHARGDATLGFVTHDYEIKASRQS